MKRAFTMIELIFVIVIIGILAAVAIPKLAATRDDAKISKIIANARTALGDMTSFYSSQGGTIWTDGNTTINAVTSVPFKDDCSNTASSSTAVSGNSFLLCDETGGTACVTFNATTTTITISTLDTGTICSAVAGDPAMTAIVNKEYQLGGNTVKR